MSRPCPAYAGQHVDAGPDCCDLSCILVRLEARPVDVPDRWEGDDS